MTDVGPLVGSVLVHAVTAFGIGGLLGALAVTWWQRRGATAPTEEPSLQRVPARLVVLVSGSGTNLQALLDATADPAYGATVVAVGADRDGIEDWPAQSAPASRRSCTA